MAIAVITKEGALTGDVVAQLNANFAELDAGGSGESFSNPTITGTVAGGASYTAPTLTSPTITGTTAIGAGATLTSPTLVTPALGTPASGVLSSCTGYDLGDVVGAGTGVLTALAAAVGTTGGVAVNGVAGVAAGYKLARSATPVAVTGTSDVTTGLSTVISCGADADADLDGTTLLAVQAVNTGGAGHILLKCWKATAANNVALIAADAAKNINWWAIGT